MRANAVVPFLLTILVMATLACGGGEPEPPTAEAPTPVAESPATPEPQPTVAERAQETAAPTETAPTEEPTATASPTEPTEPTEPAPTSTPAPAPQPTPVPEDTPTPVPTAPPEPTPAGPIAGPESFVVGEGSRLTFTVEEETSFAPVRFDAVISGTGLTGFANVDGSPSVITLDLHSLESDQSFRDRYIRQRMFPNTPKATVTIESLPDLPQSFFDGEETSGTLDGSLQIGETATTLTFDVVARHDGTVINVLGNTTFTWDQLGLTKPVFGPVTYLGDEVRVQVLIVAHEQ